MALALQPVALEIIIIGVVVLPSSMEVVHVKVPDESVKTEQ
jgi:hypothetical protein